MSMNLLICPQDPKERLKKQILMRIKMIITTCIVQQPMNFLTETWLPTTILIHLSPKNLNLFRHLIWYTAMMKMIFQLALLYLELKRDSGTTKQKLDANYFYFILILI